MPEPVAACDLLGLDPLIVADEDCLVVFGAPEAAGEALAALRALSEGEGAVRVGDVLAEGPRGRVTPPTPVGARRVVDMPLGEQLPRIC